MDRGTERTTEHGQKTVLFEIVNGNALHACSLKTKFPTRYWIRAISLCWPACNNTRRPSPRLVGEFSRQ
jgi:hypothetical protein